MQKQEILTVQDLSVSFGSVKVLENISFSLNKGEILGIVGESGSGKSLTSLAIMGLLPRSAKVSGKIELQTNGEPFNILNTDTRNIRGKRIGMIFQEPMTSLNPSMKCGHQVTEILLLHTTLSKSEAENRVLDLFEQVKLPNPERIFNAYPHELSGGQKQRVMIAIAIAAEPDILIADEPTTALDVTVQNSILQLIKEIRDRMNMAVIFISHDLGVIAEVCDSVLVMYRGKIVEEGNVQTIFHSPKENYTKGLIACRPRLETRLKQLPTVQDFTQETGFEPVNETQQERDERHEQIYSQKPILEVRHLEKFFKINNGFLKSSGEVKAVNDVSFSLYEGETLGLVGESGSGKTTLSRSLLLLEKPSAGEIIYEGKDLNKLSASAIRKLRKEIQIIFQDPYSSLNPRATIEEILTAPMKIHSIGKNSAHRRDLAAEMLEKVNLSANDLRKYPHEFSGGQRQRIGIARALSLQPRIIICDESVSALDVSVQAQVLNLLNQLKKDFSLTYIFISHDLSVVKYMSDRLIVLQHGEMVEYGNADDIYARPTSEYTRNLIEAIPRME